MKTYKTPGGTAPRLYGQLITEPHLLIAGATGSGKSTLEKSLLARLLMGCSPATAQLILIDPKKIELYPMRNLPHTIGYADTAADAVRELNRAVSEMDRRYIQMRKGFFPSSAVYIIIDEYADLMTSQYSKEITRLTTKIIQLGRAAKIHLWVCTQRPTREVIAGAIGVNLDTKIALRTATAQDSRNIIGENGAECLPRFGEMIVSSPMGITRETAPVLPLDELLNYWKGA